MNRSIGVLVFSGLLAACGSGGSGPGPTATPSLSPVPTAIPTPPPTSKPTPAPSASATPVPTAAPTLPPTTSATPAPTPSPSAAPGLRQVSGLIRIQPGSRIDSDTNDSGSAAQSNNTPQSAQIIPNAARIGGYVANQSAGEDGAVSPQGDELDAYRAQLLAGQFVNLHIADPDPASGDLDLEIYDSNLQLISGSYGDGAQATESVQVPTDGEYYIVVLPFAAPEFGIASASNYVLEVSSMAATQHLMRSELDIQPGDILVAFEETQAKRRFTAAERAQVLGLRHTGGDIGRTMRFALPQQRAKSKRRTAFGHALSAEMAAKYATFLELKRIRGRPDVRQAEPNLRRYPRRVPNDEFYPAQWHYPVINLPQAWDISTGSSDVLVAVIDSGVLVNHPDLIANLDPNDPDGVDFISLLDIANDGDRADQNADDAGDAESPDGSGSFHGTHVAGTIAAVSNNGTGVAGACWDCRIMPLRALGVGGGTGFDIDQAVRYAAGLSNDYGISPAQPADIINMSLGGGGFSQLEQNTFDQVRAAGVIVTASAGNAGTTNLEFPASYGNVVSVGAVGPDRLRAPYSQFNPLVDVAAPGGNGALGREAQVASTLGFGQGSPDDVEFGYAFYQGTSMSAPHVAGVAALMKSVFPGLTPDQFDAALADGSIVDEAGVAGRDDEYGNGIINALKAVQLAQQLASGQTPQDTPQLVVSPASVNFGASATQALISARNAGTGELQISAIDNSAAPWVSAIDVGNGGFQLQADRSALPVGVTTGELRVQSSANDVVVSVQIEVIDQALAAADEAGNHYVVLVPESDPEQGITVLAQRTTEGYSFSFTDVPEGRYLLAAGTDMDNDFSLCDEGEACALYPVNGDVQLLQVSGENIQGLELSTSFEINLQQAQSTAKRRVESGGVRR